MMHVSGEEHERDENKMSDVDVGSVEQALRWVFQRLVAMKEQFRPMATDGFSTYGRGAVVVRIRFEDLMTRNGNQLQVAYLPDKLREEFHNDVLSAYVNKYSAVQQEFVLTVVARKDTQSFIASDIITSKPNV